MMPRRVIAGYLISRTTMDLIELQQIDARDRQLVDLLDQADESFVAWTLDGRIFFWNHGAECDYGFKRHEAVGQSVHKLLRTEFPNGLTSEEFVEQLRQERHWYGDLTQTTKDGRAITVEARMYLARESSTDAVLQSNRDSTQRRQLEASNRRLVEVNAQEEARRHLARELHDEVGQILSTVAVNLEAVKGLCHSEARPRLDECISIVGRSIQQLRNLWIELRPPMLDDLGLISTLRCYADRQTQRAGLVLHFEADASGERMFSDLELACYRVVQEALTNVLRHAHATQVWLEFHEDAGGIRLLVSDDGCGFDPASIQLRAAQQQTLGVRGMQERAELLGGRFTVESQPDKGTTIRVWFPTKSLHSQGFGTRSPRA